VNSFPLSPSSQTSFQGLIAGVLSQAHERLRDEPDIPGGLAQCIEIVVLDRALCSCHFYDVHHSHCALCASEIVYDGDGPVEPTGRPVAVLPDGAQRCANCDLDLHRDCASLEGLCPVCFFESKDSACGDVSPSHDVWDASNALTLFMSDHIAAETSLDELARTNRDLDELGALITARKAEIASRVLALTALSPAS
jgi:hypothetical protein